jgi:A/G-specific adenine glycosylase
MTARRKPTVGRARGRELLRRSLLAWYDTHRRDLPWRQDRDPYRVWLSEIMLQQTRVAAVLEHYQAFLGRFPTIEKLAAARQASVLAAWSGLGYYRRARMLHAAAQEIVKEHAGKFPTSAQQLRRLPGIGRYTAAAIASIAFGEPVAVVDGNVARVLERLLHQHLAGEGLWQAAAELLAAQRPGDFNQAMMELGATVCLPRQPACLVCPLLRFCATRGDGEKRRPKPRQNQREIHYALDCHEGSVFLVERPAEAALMPGMWELPEISHEDDPASSWLSLRHSITTTDYLVRVRRAPAHPETKGRWVLRRRLRTLPLTGLARKILRAAGFEE